jgi:mitochondrial cardiolipin hydrolase
MDFDALDCVLRASLADLRLDYEEREALRDLGAALKPEQVRFLRNRAFALVEDHLHAPDSARAALAWLRQVVRTLDLHAEAAREPASAHFSPGESCRQRLLTLCRSARISIEVCVFTISDDLLSAELLAAHRRGVQVRLLSDDDKRFDAGSDVQRLGEAGIAVRCDRGEPHMHHKFAIFDRRLLASGSFNWTRSASTVNHENLLVIQHAGLVGDYLGEFERLWRRFAPPA